jgi:hypothetical protein
LTKIEFNAGVVTSLVCLLVAQPFLITLQMSPKVSAANIQSNISEQDSLTSADFTDYKNPNFRLDMKYPKKMMII